MALHMQEFRQIFLPYCLKRLADGRFIVLNRKYKPLGIWESDHVVYEDHPSVCKLKLTAAKAKKLSWSGEGFDGDFVFLYNDGCVPTASAVDMRAYLGRIDVLAKLQATFSSP